MEFQFTYRGSAVQNEMEIKELSYALIAIGDLLEECDKILNQNKTSVQVKVKGSFKSGSFLVDFEIVQKTMEQIKDFFTSSEVQAVVNAKEIIGLLIGAGGLFYLLKKLKGEQPTKEIEIPCEKLLMKTKKR